MKKKFPLNKVYTLLEPGPVILVSSSYEGKNNLMPASWHMMIDFNPPLVACVISDQNHSFKMIKKSGECAINIPTLEIAKKTAAAGNLSGAKTDKFRLLGFTPVKSRSGKAPLIDECYASLECKVHDAKLAGKYNLFILQVVNAWVDPAVKNPKTFHHRGGEYFMAAGKTFKIKQGRA